MFFGNHGLADPIGITGPVPPPPDAPLPLLAISSPNNYTLYNSNIIPLIFNTSCQQGTNFSAPHVYEIYYLADWKQANETLYKSSIDLNGFSSGNKLYTNFSVNLNLTKIPDGTHTIKLVATFVSNYKQDYMINNFLVTNSSTINFTTDASPPKISILSIENKTYQTPNLPLNVTSNEKISNFTYSIDGQSNVTFAGDMTLTDLSYGTHGLIVYGCDEAGNIGAAEVAFTVQKPFPVAETVAAVAGISVVAVGAGLFVSFKRVKKPVSQLTQS